MLHKVAALCLVNLQGPRKATKRNPAQHNIPAANSELSSRGDSQVECGGPLWGRVLGRIHLWGLFLPVYTGFPIGVSTAWELNWFKLLLAFYPNAIFNNKVWFFFNCASLIISLITVCKHFFKWCFPYFYFFALWSRLAVKVVNLDWITLLTNIQQKKKIALFCCPSEVYDNKMSTLPSQWYKCHLVWNSQLSFDILGESGLL